MFLATTLVHKGGMDIGVHAIRSFARHFANTYTLHIHTDGSTGEHDHALLLEAAQGIQVKIVTAAERKEVVQPKLLRFTKTNAFLQLGGIYSKLEIPMYEQAPYFFFDSDVIWLCPVANLAPVNAPNVFSTESWSWYNGVANDKRWIKAKTPRRVNSGFYYIGQAFPYEKMEAMLTHEMFDPNIPEATDQEIFAYLFNDLEYYHPEDLKRSRIGINYSLNDDSSAALHFPGKMWIQHLEQIEQLGYSKAKPAMSIRFQPAVRLTKTELFRMRAQVKLSESPLMAVPLIIMRRMRKAFTGNHSD